ncbi:MAG: efflux RND transporter permease subunit, partial [Cyanobacteria bacterium P01_H01_bin.121]
FEAQLPTGISLDILLDQNQYVQARLNAVLLNLFTAIALVAGITLILMGWQAALVVSAALPLSILMVFGGMRLLQIQLHQMSITGLILALGLLIDNAIVIVDEVHGRRQAGAAPAAAIQQSVKQLAIPLFASTVTTVLAFMPIALAPGGTGEFTGAIAISVILAIVSSYFLALTVIPALAARMRPINPDTAPFWQTGLTIPALSQFYRWFLQRLLARPLVAVALALVLPIVGFSQMGTLAQQFFPPTDRDQFNLELELPAQTSLAETQTVAIATRSLMLQYPEVTGVSWFLGETAPTFYYNVVSQRQNQANFAQAIVQLEPGVRPQPVIRKLQSDLDQAFPQAQMLVRQLEQGPPFDAPVELRIYGPDIDQLRVLGNEMRVILSQIPNVEHTRATLSEAQPTLDLQLDEQAVQLANLDRQAIASQLNATLEGVVGGSVLEGTEELPVRVRIAGSQRGDLAQLQSLDLLSETGDRVPLSALGSVTLNPDIAVIARRDSQRINTIQAFITAGTLPSAVLGEFRQALEAQDFQLPPGYRYEFGGEAEAQGDAVGNLFSTVGVLMIIMVATLVLSLGSFWYAGLIGVIAVSALGLALLALKIFGFPFGFMAILGALGLMGLAINDSIVVLTALKNDPLAQTGRVTAIAEVVIHSTRHVVTTTLTTIAGFVPLLLDPSGFWPPLAIAIAGGLGGATLLALFLIPAAYRLLLGKTTTPVVEEDALLVHS